MTFKLDIDGAARKRRSLSLQPNDNNEFICPINECLHISFRSQRGVRKHVNNIHPWYYYFDQQPKINRELAKEQSHASLRIATNRKPAFSTESGIGKEFLSWLKTPCGGGRAEKDAKNIARRAMKYLMASFDENTAETVLTDDYIDCFLGSPKVCSESLDTKSKTCDYSEDLSAIKSPKIRAKIAKIGFAKPRRRHF